MFLLGSENVIFSPENEEIQSVELSDDAKRSEL